MTSSFDAPPEPGRRLVRPYAVTGGRVRTAAELPLESQCFVTPAGRRAQLSFERAVIAHLCGEVLSIAEVSAHAKLPLGVARVIVGDMRDEGLLDVHVPEQQNGRLSAAVLEKVLDGLRAL